MKDENALLVFGEDFDVPKLVHSWSKIEESPNPCIFVVRDRIPAVPYTDENLFTMQRISDKEFAMVPVPGGVRGVASVL